ncbi:MULTISPECIES: hypothetical protein [Listeria]|uniref:hypothetical protein n=1 Tax=Listeria TaxID=1637 RepID=UPI000B58C07F|nr:MULTISPECIES: hypothetical protein [Listeria]
MYSLFEQEKMMKNEIIFTLLNAMNLKKAVCIRLKHVDLALFPSFIDMREEIVELYDENEQLKTLLLKQIITCSIVK